MLLEMVNAAIEKKLSTDYSHLKLPAITYAKISSAQKLDAFQWEELVIHNDDTGNSFQGHIEVHWYEYTLTVLNRFGSPDMTYPVLPRIRSRKQFQEGAIVAAAFPYGELTPSIIGEVRL